MKKLSFLPAFTLLLSIASFAQDNDDCYENFFASGTKLKNKSAVKIVLANKKEQTLTRFIKDNYVAREEAEALIDVDRDGTKELVMRNFTGGAHCCDELYIFKNIGTNKYTLAAKLFAGNTCVDDKNNFIYDLHESFGYFYTCYACGLEKEDKDGKPTGLEYMSAVNLRYAKGKIIVAPGTEKQRQTIAKNLQYIKKLGWDGGVKEPDFDDGRRKELALNLAVSYFLFGQNLTATKALFDTWYNFKDATEVWKAFIVHLNNVKENMSL